MSDEEAAQGPALAVLWRRAARGCGLLKLIYAPGFWMLTVQGYRAAVTEEQRNEYGERLPDKLLLTKKRPRGQGS